jgi:hypothetical protein
MCFLKKIGFFTRNPIKLDLHFSDFSTILTIFERFSLDTLDLKTDFLRIGPWVLRSSPWKDLRPRNVVQTANRDEDGRNPARGRPGLAGKGPRRGLGLPSVPFEAVQRSEEVPDGVLGGSVDLKTASAPAPVN